MNKLLNNLLIIFLISGCSDLFEYSMYDTPVESHNANIENTQRVQNNYRFNDSLSFILIADPHNFYDELSTVIDEINKLDNIQFVICNGDITDAGIADELNGTGKLSRKCKYPVFSVIGNHDYLSNGSYLYSQYYGSKNYSFTLGDYKFILFDDIVWENKNRSPHFDWLKEELDDSSKFNILITHIPPGNDQLEGKYNLIYQQIVIPGNTILCLHGHEHIHKTLEYNGIFTVVSGSVGYKCFNIITLKDEKVNIQHITL